jgi:hypothetical protein
LPDSPSCEECDARIVLGGQLIGLAAIVFLGRILLVRSRARR